MGGCQLDGMEDGVTQRGNATSMNVALIWRSDGQGASAGEGGVECHVEEGASNGGDGKPDVEERVASIGGLVVVWMMSQYEVELIN